MIGIPAETDDRISGVMWGVLCHTSGSQPVLAPQVCDLETVLTTERARAEEAEKATARAERRLKQAVKGARCISYMYTISRCPASIMRPSLCVSILQLRRCSLQSGASPLMTISASVKCAIQGLREALKLAP